MPPRRAVHVCAGCHKRKIRCDLSRTHIPCSKCQELGEECILRTRKAYDGRRRRKQGSGGNESSGEDSDTPGPAISHADQVSIVSAAVTQPATNKSTPYFIGDGGYGSILETAAGTLKQRHFFIPATVERALPPEDLEYLEIKGCFSLPAESQTLIRAYFQYVHPLFPVIDADLFMKDYVEGGAGAINLLLLWSMFSISASYVPGLCHKEIKQSFFSRAKTLYDISHENDKVILIQAALLLSFWFADIQDIMQSWYWTGIAFNFAQTLGIHRVSASLDENETSSQRRLWRNIWNCCMLRDFWQSFGLGRPLRIAKNDNGNDTLPFIPDDHLQPIHLDGHSVYTAAESVALAKIWQSLLTVTDSLRGVIATKENVNPGLLDSSIASVAAQEADHSTLLLEFASRHLVLHKQAALVAMYRLGTNQAKLKESTQLTTWLVQSFPASDASPLTIPLLVPAMLTYLSELKVGVRSQTQTGDDLKVYLDFLSAIEENFPAALIVRRVFEAAIKIILAMETSSQESSPSVNVAMSKAIASCQLGEAIDTSMFT